MKTQILYLVCGTLMGAVLGFMGANYLNRASSNKVASPPPANSTEAVGTARDTLSPEEIKAQLAKADSNPGDIAFQKSLGIALYGYGAAKEDSAVIVDAIRLLERADEANRSDRDVIVALGNAHFDIGYFKKESARFVSAREYYERALGLTPGDPNILVDVGLTYALTVPSDLPKAIEAYEKSLATDPKHERTLQFMTDALIKMGRLDEARAGLARLREVNPSNPMIPEFSSGISGSRPSR